MWVGGEGTKEPLQVTGAAPAMESGLRALGRQRPHLCRTGLTYVCVQDCLSSASFGQDLPPERDSRESKWIH